MKRVLIDASSAILLHKAHIFEDVADQYRLKMVPTVFCEITVAHRTGAEVFREARDAGKIHMALPDPGSRLHAKAPSLHAGELETIMAYKEGAAHFIMMDDGKGARVCRKMDIPYINALLCPIILFLSGKIDGAARQSAFMHLMKIGRYGDEIVAHAEKADVNRLAPFFP